MSQQGANGGQLRADGDVDIATLDQVDVGRVVDDGHHLLRPQPLGQQRGYDIGLVIVGQCQENIGVGDVLFHQQVAVRGAALQYDGAVEGVGQMPAARRVHLDDLYLVAAFDGFGQALADLPTAGDDDAFVGLVQPAHFAHDRANIRFGGDEKYFVVGLDHGIALGQDRPVAPENRRHAGFYIRHVLAQLAQLLAHQRTAVIGFNGDQLRLALGKVDHLQGTRNFDQALDVVSHHLFGADQHVHWNRVVVEKPCTGQVSRLTDAGDFGGRVK